MRQRGFSLLEISIALMIIGLIVGGISFGSSLIRNAEIQSIGSDFERYVGAIKKFQDKYNALPGDFSTATSVFGDVLNGDDDGFITGDEQFRAWKHLARAKMIEGNYTGFTEPGGSVDRVPGINVPASQVTGAGWGLVYVDANSGGYYANTQDFILPNHVLWFGGRSVTGNDNLQTPVLTAEEASQIDRKFDDGIYNYGKIMGQDNDSGDECASGASRDYDYSIAGKICALVFKTGF